MFQRSGRFILALLCVLASSSSSGGEQIHTVDDVASARVGVMTGSTGETVAEARFPSADIQSFDDIMDAVAAVNAGHLDAIVTSFPTAYQVVRNNPELRVLPEQLDQENTSVAIRKGNPELLAGVNRIIGELHADGTLKAMHERWIKQDNTPYEEAEITVPTSGTPLRVGVSATREPLSFVEGGRVTGHDGELARRLAAGLGRPLEFVDMKFMALIPALRSGKIDLIVTGMTATPERAKAVDFSQSYFSNAQVLLVRGSTSLPAVVAAATPQTGMFASTADLRDKRIAVLLGSVYDTFARKTYPQATVLQFDTAADQQLAVLAGKVDASLADEEGLIEVLAKNPRLAMFGEPLLRLPMGVGFRKGNAELRDAFNRFLAGIRQDGVYDDMVTRWITRQETRMPQITVANPKGSLVAGVTAGGLPFAAIQDGELAGFDIEMLKRFAASLGKDLQFAQMPFGGLIAANASGKVDLIAASMFITEERKQRIDFSDPYYETAGRAYALVSRIAGAPAEAPVGAPLLAALDDLKDKRIGVQLGTVFDLYATRTFPQAAVLQFPTFQEVALAVSAGKVDAGLVDVDTLAEVMHTQSELVPFGEPLFSSPVGAGFNKDNPELRQAFDAFLKDIRANGVYDDMVERWMRQRSQQMPELSADASGGVLVVGISTGGFPFCAVKDGELSGFDVELAKRFGASIGKDVRFANQEFGGLIAALRSGKIDVIISDMYVTAERSEQIDFSAPYFAQSNVAFTLRANTLPRATAADHPAASSSTAPPAERSFFGKVADGFEANIVREQRYLLLWEGAKATVLISVLSTLFGTALGALVCFMRMSPSALLRVPAHGYIAVLRGIPVVVLLMLVFYVVFGSVNIDPVLVAVIAFGMNFAAYVSEMFRSGIEGIDPGQSEAGIAMGFTRTQTFLYIVFPQMLQRVLPVYKGEFISLVKMTSVVGYIAVQDLTKASDTIRSRTFDAFFPLVVVAILYFLIAWVLMQALEYLERRTDPRARKGASMSAA